MSRQGSVFSGGSGAGTLGFCVLGFWSCFWNSSERELVEVEGRVEFLGQQGEMDEGNHGQWAPGQSSRAG
jgi:hypothetical protein